MLFSRKKWDPKGLHCYVTGGSQGLGLATALYLVKRGAHVSIVARSQKGLDAALKDLKDARLSPDQKIYAYSYSLDTHDESAKALEAACVPYDGKAPDAIFAVAGAARPKFLVDMTPEDMMQGMNASYWVQAWTAFAATKMMVRQKKQGSKIILVASTLGYMSFVGWSSYAPGKHALRGLADTLDSELKLYSINVHIFFAGTMYSPGYDKENETKPSVTRTIEGADEGLTPEQAAIVMMKGVESHQTHISSDLITSLFRASTRGSAPRHNFFVDAVLDLIAFIGVPIWRLSADKEVLKHRKEHEEYLRAKGMFENIETES